MSDYDPDREYFRQLSEQYVNEPVGKVVLTGSMPAWLCECYQWNAVSVDCCNNCGQPKPPMTLARVEAAISRAFKASTTMQDEMWYFNALVIVILARQDGEEVNRRVA